MIIIIHLIHSQIAQLCVIGLALVKAFHPLFPFVYALMEDLTHDQRVLSVNFYNQVNNILLHGFLLHTIDRSARCRIRIDAFSHRKVKHSAKHEVDQEALKSKRKG